MNRGCVNIEKKIRLLRLFMMIKQLEAGAEGVTTLAEEVVTLAEEVDLTLLGEPEVGEEAGVDSSSTRNSQNATNATSWDISSLNVQSGKEEHIMPNWMKKKRCS